MTRQSYLAFLFVWFTMVFGPFVLSGADIHQLVLQGDLNKVKKLLDRNPVCVDLKNKNDETALHMAAFMGNDEMVTLLLRFKPDINAVTRSGFTPIHLACIFGQLEVVRELIGAGADLNTRSHEGGTPLHWAVAARFPKLVTLLKLNGARKMDRNFPLYQGYYFGLQPPGMDPIPFAPKILYHITPFVVPTFSPDGKEVYFSLASYHFQNSKIWFMKQKDGKWQPPRRASFSGNFSEGSPFFSPDGKIIYFYSNMPSTDVHSGKRSIDIYAVERVGDSWGRPKNLGPVINSNSTDASPCVTKNMNLYFHRRENINNRSRWFIYRSEYKNSGYQTATKLADPINGPYNAAGPCVAPDEKYIIFHSNRTSEYSAGNHLFISFRKADGSWSKAKSVSKKINAYQSMSASLSPDGKYLFFYSRRGAENPLFWVDIKIIQSE